MDIGTEVMKVFMKGHVWVYRKSSGGLGSSMGGKVVILTTTGRKSGERREAPLVAIRDGERYLVAATAGGDDKNPSWYYNVAANPEVKIQDHDRVMRMVATVAEGDEREALYQRFIDSDERFAGYREKTDREIPVIILEPIG